MERYVSLDLKNASVQEADHAQDDDVIVEDTLFHFQLSFCRGPGTRRLQRFRLGQVESPARKLGTAGQWRRRGWHARRER
jgi:hypothetical protein